MLAKRVKVSMAGAPALPGGSGRGGRWVPPSAEVGEESPKRSTWEG